MTDTFDVQGDFAPAISTDIDTTTAPALPNGFVKLGLVQATRDSAGRLWFTRAELVTVARIQRLRTGLSLNWAAIGLVLDLLDRIDVLERDLRARPRPPAKE